MKKCNNIIRESDCSTRRPMAVGPAAVASRTETRRPSKQRVASPLSEANRSVPQAAWDGRLTNNRNYIWSRESTEGSPKRENPTYTPPVNDWTRERSALSSPPIASGKSPCGHRMRRKIDGARATWSVDSRTDRGLISPPLTSGTIDRNEYHVSASSTIHIESKLSVITQIFSTISFFFTFRCLLKALATTGSFGFWMCRTRLPDTCYRVRTSRWGVPSLPLSCFDHFMVGWALTKTSKDVPVLKLGVWVRIKI